jgi:hypothetical protein
MDQKTKQATGPAKEPYIRPDFRCERVFASAQVVSCGKVSITQESCRLNLKTA